MIAAAALLLAAAPTLAPAPQSPVALFKAACTGGSVSLARGTAAPIAYDKLPHGAREALGQTLMGPGQPGMPGAPRASDVPGPVFAIGPDQAIFLLAPSGDAQASGSFAHACAVIWKGEHYSEGRESILPNMPAAMVAETPRSNPLGLASFGALLGSLHLSVTTLRDWTVLKAVPRPDEPVPGAN
jgi:hypothetical protein